MTVGQRGSGESRSSRLGQHHVIKRRLYILHELAELRPLLAEFRRVVRGGEALLVGPLQIVHHMRAVLAAVQADRYEAGLAGHKFGALLHQRQHVVLIVGPHLHRGDLGNDALVRANIGHGRSSLRVPSATTPEAPPGFPCQAGAFSIASAISTVRRAISACMRSTMRPSICTTPLSWFSGRSNAAMVLRACATSSTVGENAALQGPTWFGWISVLPSKPMSRACAHSAS